MERKASLFGIFIVMLLQFKCEFSDILQNAVDMALADSQCFGLDNPELKYSCIFNKVVIFILPCLLEIFNYFEEINKW